MSEYMQQRRCDGNAGLASTLGRRMQRGGPGLFSGKRARGFTVRGSHERMIRTYKTRPTVSRSVVRQLGREGEEKGEIALDLRVGQSVKSLWLGLARRTHHHWC